jgi:large subunit ribosomal protein L15
MQLNHLTRPSSLKRPYRRVGRGQSSTRGKQSGRGGKGQTARAGNKRRPELRDIIKKLPKRRGFGKNRGRTVVGDRQDAIAISIERLGALFESGAEITHKILVQKGIISGRMMPPVKIVGGGELSKKFTLKGIPVSASARAAIEKAGGTAALLADAPAPKVKPSKPARAPKKLKS